MSVVLVLDPVTFSGSGLFLLSKLVMSMVKRVLLLAPQWRCVDRVVKQKRVAYGVEHTAGRVYRLLHKPCTSFSEWRERLGVTLERIAGTKEGKK